MKMRTKLIVEVLGAASIVASLMFVGFQLSLDRTIALGAQLNNRAESGLQIYALLFENETWIHEEAERKRQGQAWSWWNDDIQEYQDRFDVSDEGMYRLYLRARMTVITFDNSFYQYQIGLIDEDGWSPIRETNKNALRAAVNRSAYQNSVGMRPQARAMVRELLAELDVETTN